MKSLVTPTVNVIKTLIVEALPPKHDKVIFETRLKESIYDFAKVSNLLEVKSFEDLKCNSVNKTEFDRMLLYCQHTFLSRERDTMIRKWGKPELQILTQFGRLLCMNWFT